MEYAIEERLIQVTTYTHQLRDGSRSLERLQSANKLIISVKRLGIHSSPNHQVHAPLPPILSCPIGYIRDHSDMELKLFATVLGLY
jgi:hypothetical protein